MDRSVLFLCFVLCLRNTTGENFNLLLLLPSTDSPTWKFAFGTEMSGAAALIAIDEVNQLGLYGGHSLKADYVNTRCNPVVGLGGAVDGIMEKNYTCFIGPPCSGVCANVATLAAYRNIPVFNGVCQAIEMLDKKKFKTLTRLLGTFDLVGEATVSLIRHHKWKRIAIIAQLHNDRIWRLVRDGVEFVAKKNNIFVSSVTTIDERTQLGEIYDVKESLIKSKKVSRIIVVAVRGETFRQLMLHAYDLNMTNGDYVFIGINFYTQKRVYGDYHWKQNDSRDADAKDAYTSVFWVKYYEPNTARYSQFQADVQTRAAQVTGFQYLPNEKTPYQAANLYEAVWMYALALNATLSEGGDIYNGTLISQRLWGHSFPSMTGGVSFNKNGDRQQGYTILQTHQDGSKKEVGFYFARKGYFELSDSDDIQWRNGQVSAPSDSPKCGWNGEFCDNGDNDKREFRVLLGSLLALVFVILVACAVGIGVVYKRQKWQREVGDMKWKIQWDDIIVDKPTRQTSFSLISLGTFSSATRCNAAFRHIRSGIYNGVSVAIKKFKPIHTSLPQAALQHLKQLHDLSHKNTVKFIGACFDSPHCYILMEFCSKESLEDMLSNDDIKLDWTFKHSLIQDIIHGLGYIRTSFLKHHGNLKTSNCLLDSRFVVKLSDFGHRNIFGSLKTAKAKDLLWSAPELLRQSIEKVKDKEALDMYSLGIILQEILLRQGPFFTGDLEDPEEIINEVTAGLHPLTRPKISKHDCPPDINDLVCSCWEEQPDRRIKLHDFKQRMRNISGDLGRSNLMDDLLKRMESYANNLEGVVEQRTGQYLDEKRRVEELLYRLLPKSIADQLQTKGSVEPEAFDCVSIYFSDIVGFTTISAQSTPLQVVNMLNDLYMCFDEIIGNYNVYKVETIGDAYMVVSGLPNKIGHHAEEIANMALKIRAAVFQFKIGHLPDTKLQLRIGLNSGPVVAGVVGLKMPRYCLFGDTVNTASRMESTGEALKIHISEETASLLAKDFNIEQRGEIEVKGKGKMKTYWLTGKTTTVLTASADDVSKCQVADGSCEEMC